MMKSTMLNAFSKLPQPVKEVLLVAGLILSVSALLTASIDKDQEAPIRSPNTEQNDFADNDLLHNPTRPKESITTDKNGVPLAESKQDILWIKDRKDLIQKLHESKERPNETKFTPATGVPRSFN